MARRLSGLQLEVLALYRSALRASRTKGDKAPDFTKFAQYQFRKDAAAVSKKDISKIEFMIRNGKRKIRQFESPSVTSISF